MSVVSIKRTSSQDELVKSTGQFIKFGQVRKMCTAKYCNLLEILDYQNESHLKESKSKEPSCCQAWKVKLQK